MALVEVCVVLGAPGGLLHTEYYIEPLWPAFLGQDRRGRGLQAGTDQGLKVTK